MSELQPVLLADDLAYQKRDQMKELLAEQAKVVIKPQTSLPTEKISDVYKNLRVYGFVADNSACGYYRVINPLHMLKLHGAQVVYSSVSNFWDMQNADIIVVPRQYGPEIYELIRSAAWEGKICTYEIDDNLEAVLPSSPAYSVYYPGSSASKMVPKFVRNCVGLTTTTPECARWYYQYNRNIAIVENFIDFSLRDWGVDVTWNGIEPDFNLRPIQKPECWEGKTVLSWAGGSTHKSDLQQIGPAVKAALVKYPELVFAFYGSVENALSFVSEFDLPVDKVYRVPARHFLDYPKGLQGMDIALAPILPCEFNASKSYLRPLEMLASGISCIATNFVPYARFERENPGSILTVGDGKRSYEDWLSAISFLVENPDVRQKMQEDGRKLIVEKYSLERNFHKWPQAWKLIADQMAIGEVGPPVLDKPRGFFKSTGDYNPNHECGCGSGKKKRACCGSAWS